MPLVEWMRNEDKARFWGILREPRTLQRGYFKPAAVETLIDEHVRGRRNRSGILWRLLVFELWHRNFMEARSSWGLPRTVPEIRNSEVHLPVRAVATSHPQPRVSVD